MNGRAADLRRCAVGVLDFPIVGLALALLLAGIFSMAWAISGAQGAALAGFGALAVLLASWIARPERDRDRADPSHVILEGISSAVIVIDPDGVIEQANKAAAVLFDDTSGCLVGSNISSLMPPSVGLAHAAYTQNFEGERVAMNNAREVVARTSTGREFPAEVMLSSIERDGERRIIGVVNDISWRKTAEAQLHAAMSDLDRVNAELDKFAYIASHDLKAPLRVIDNASQWIAEDLEPHLTADTRESLDMLRGRVHRMEQLLDALLEHSRIGRVPQQQDFTDGDALAADVLARVDIPEGFTVSFDEGFRRQTLPRAQLLVILGHLIDNAIRHHDRAEGTIDVTLENEGARMIFRVRDDGPGIPEQYHEKVFEVFQTLVRRDEVETSGMGLAIVQKHATIAGGAVSIEPTSGRGTTVRLEWPLSAAERKPELVVL